MKYFIWALLVTLTGNNLHAAVNSQQTKLEGLGFKPAVPGETSFFIASRFMAETHDDGSIKDVYSLWRGTPKPNSGLIAIKSIEMYGSPGLAFKAKGLLKNPPRQRLPSSS